MHCLKTAGMNPLTKNFSIHLLIVFMLISPAILTSQNIDLGSGSYRTTLPFGEVGPQTFNGSNAIPKVSADFDQPIQTNDFWSSLIYPFFGNSHSNILYAHPLNLKAVDSGLEMGYTTDHIFAANDFLYPYSAHLKVGVNGLSASQTLTHSYGDWTVTALWEDGPLSMEATLGHGLPYAFFHINGGDAVITAETTPTVWFQQDEVLGVTVQGKHYGIFAPTGATWTSTSPFQSDLNGENFLSVALLPDNQQSTLELFRSHAYAFVTDSRIEWEYHDQTAEVLSTYSYETILMDNSAGNLDQTMTALYRHQWLNTSDPLTEHSYHSPRGEMRLLEGNSFTTQLTFTGIIPALPDRGDYNPTELLGHVEAVATESLPVGPTYENGKLMARFSHLIHIADQVNASNERDYFLDQLKSRLEDWFTAGGEQEYAYLDNWDVLTGYPSGYGADNQINDHHFHAAYAVMSAATIAQYDSVWASQDNWGAMVNLLIKDANNWDRTDDQFPFLRTHDAYAGHSWAAGHGDFAEGNNQESSSESMNFAAAAFLWGQATNQPEIRDLGIFLYATETSAVEQYWFDIDDVNFPAEYPHVAIGMVWGGKGVHSTWFGADPEFIHGINILPMTSASLYLGRHPDYVEANYAEIVAERNGQPVIWQDVLWEYLALANPDQALSYYYANLDYPPFDGESRAHTLHWLFNMKKMGQLDTTIVADHPSYAVLRDADNDLTYVAYNPDPQERLVNFSDGFSMLVPSRQMASHSTSTENPDAPVALLMADKTSGKVPLFVNFTGSNSFDPNGSELSYYWSYGDGDISVVADGDHTYTEVGIYEVTLTVTNAENLSSSETVTIEVLGNGTPYLGTPFQIPGTVEAEFYDEGGEGVAYHDNDGMNWGVPFRSDEGVDIEASNDAGGGYNIGWIEDGEWVEYTVSVPVGRMYQLTPVVASVPGGGRLHIEFNGVDLTGEQSVQVTGGWQFWEDMDIPPVWLNAGEQVMHVAFYGGQFNLNRIVITNADATDTELQQLPDQFVMHQNFPNPFNPSTRLSFGLPEDMVISLVIFDLQGRVVKTLQEGSQNAGWYQQEWNGLSDAGVQVPTGIYFAKLSAGSHSQMVKMLYLK